ncbi:hypothetical protein D3C76_1040530 [compost metagenome]
MDAQPGQPAFGQPPSHDPKQHGHRDQQAGQQARARLPGGVQGVLDLVQEGAEFFPVMLWRIEQGGPEPGVEYAPGPLGHFGFQQAAADGGNLGQQFGGAGLERYQGFQFGVDPGFLFGQGDSLEGDIGLLGRGIRHWRRAQHAQLRLQLVLLGQQQCREAIDLLDERLHQILRAFQLAVVDGL